MERVNGWCSCEDRSASQIWLGSSENEDKEHALEVDCDRYDAVWSIGACPGQAPRSDGRGSRSPRAVVACGLCKADKIDCARKKVSVDTLLCFMMHRVQKSRAESLMANSSIFVLKNKFWKKMQSRTEMVTA